MTLLNTVLWASNLSLFIYRKIGVPLVLLMPLLYKVTPTLLGKLVSYPIVISSPINLRYYKSEHLSYIELYRKGIKEKSIESFLIFLARTLEIIGFTALSVVMAATAKSNLSIRTDSEDLMLVLLAALNAFGVLKPAVLGYDAPQAPKAIKPLPKTASHLPKQPEKQKSQQSPGLPECDQEKTVLTQKVVLNP